MRTLLLFLALSSTAFADGRPAWQWSPLYLRASQADGYATQIDMFLWFGSSGLKPQDYVDLPRRAVLRGRALSREATEADVRAYEIHVARLVNAVSSALQVRK